VGAFSRWNGQSGCFDHFDGEGRQRFITIKMHATN
jgi:hypothetical protein